jgi:hypothetical protein
MTFDQAAHLGATISRMLVAQAVAPRLQIAILGGALACAFLALPPRARRAALAAHTAGLAETVDECVERYNSEALSQHH